VPPPVFVALSHLGDHSFKSVCNRCAEQRLKPRMGSARRIQKSMGNSDGGVTGGGKSGVGGPAPANGAARLWIRLGNAG
jgi:hypothetical protein